MSPQLGIHKTVEHLGCVVRRKSGACLDGRGFGGPAAHHPSVSRRPWPVAAGLDTVTDYRRGGAPVG